MSLHPTLEPRWTVDRNDAATGEPDRLSAACTIEGLNLHLTAFRVCIVVNGTQEASNPEDADELGDLYNLYEGGRFQTATIPGFAGTWVIYAIPFQD